MIIQFSANYFRSKNLHLINVFTLLALFTFSIAACNQNTQQKATYEEDTSVQQHNDTQVNAPINKTTDSILNQKNDTLLYGLSTDILTYLKTKNYKQLAALIHPDGVRFSPYGNIDTGHDKKLSATQLLSLSESSKKVLWGNYDGSGDPIKLSLADYFKKFVYDADFLNTKEKSINSFINNDSRFTNLRLVYPSGSFVLYHIPGINPKYSGMDFKTLVIVFKKENGKAWLVGVVHDQWRA